MHTTTLHGRDWSAELLEHLKRVTAELESVWKHLGQTDPNSHAPHKHWSSLAESNPRTTSGWNSSASAFDA